MKWNYIHLLTLICVFLLTCNGLYADEVCSPDYPDQYPYSSYSCDGIEPLAWETDLVETTSVAPSSSVVIFVTGGKLPLQISVGGKGFWLDADHNLRNGVVNSRAITIYTDEDACGSAQISVTDGCTSVTETILSTSGKWVYLETLPCKGIGSHPHIGVVQGHEESWCYKCGIYKTKGLMYSQRYNGYSSGNWSREKPECPDVTTEMCDTIILPWSDEWCGVLPGFGSCSGNQPPTYYTPRYTYPFWGGTIFCLKPNPVVGVYEWRCN